jgi:hypothetical protein
MLLNPKRCQELFVLVSECALAIGTGRTEVKEVDRLNLYWAAMQATPASDRGIINASGLRLEPRGLKLAALKVVTAGP